MLSVQCCPFYQFRANTLSLCSITLNYLDTVKLIESGNYKQNIEALGGQFEGDMVLEEAQKRALFGLEKTGLINTNYRWPNGTVPYVLADGYFTQAQVEQIERGLRAIEAVSCIRFVPHTDEVNYVEVIVSENKSIRIEFELFLFLFSLIKSISGRAKWMLVTSR